MGIHLYRIDDRLIHGQVVVGWGQPLNIRLLVLVDDLVASSDWEKELYRMAVPPDMEVRFADVDTAIRDQARSGRVQMRFASTMAELPSSLTVAKQFSWLKKNLRSGNGERTLRATLL